MVSKMVWVRTLVRARQFSMAGAVLFMACAATHAAPVFHTFEGFDDSTPLTTELSDLVFQNATVIKAGFSLNESEFPPRSGENVVYDDGGGITIRFGTPVYGVGAYFSYVSPLTFTALDRNGAVLGSLSSAFANNLAVSGDSGSSPNEHLFLAALGGEIASLFVAGDPIGSSFVLDDLTVDFGAVNTVPEPSSVALVALALALSWRRRRPRDIA